MRILSSRQQIENYIKTTKIRKWEDEEEIEQKVRRIITEVKDKKDEAVLYYTRLFDCEDICLDELQVTQEEIERAYFECEREDRDFIDALNAAYKNIYEYHMRQKEESWFYVKNGSLLGQIIRPLEKVGIYVPGGKGSYPSTVLMNSIPAKVAGVEKIIMVTPPDKQKNISKYTLAAAKICGVDIIYKVGGAQAIAALAFGTQIIPKVDKIVGPGNIFVATAKKLLFGYVDIDSVAGPSEVMVIADGSANPKYIAADLLSQAEHDPMARCILVTTSIQVAQEVSENVEKMLARFENSVALEAIEKNGAVIVVDSLSEAAEIANIIAPEHLEICSNNVEEVLLKIRNAGAVFIGEYSPEPVGDYIAGPNHVLPTSGTASFFSPLGVYDFVKKMSLIKYSKEQFFLDAQHAINIAQKEGFLFHANSLKVRLEDV
ncbi:histidinol dehydrogenase [Anaerocellum danielii]|uniref:Histidinol dehydrogenase n=1 Tax=Anaerocellum danielii TaxID=1387557 RepID=A0ABZ0TVZ7_9FIRM|nr:histidinol dehydrogenase [Caldicellulosiruptor danielii]WPX07628.1 histidinol dehydrogenase [Caldicellulosiruptor danielii]